jgi:hypothetical protein
MGKFVKYDLTEMSIRFYDDEGRELYSDGIDINGLNSTGEVLDWIFQIKSKSWCSPQMLDEFISAIEDVSLKHFNNTAQGVFCPGGAHRKVSWKEKKSEKV